jgi:hypothetical protein
MQTTLHYSILDSSYCCFGLTIGLYKLQLALVCHTNSIFYLHGGVVRLQALSMKFLSRCSHIYLISQFYSYLPPLHLIYLSSIYSNDIMYIGNQYCYCELEDGGYCIPHPAIRIRIRINGWQGLLPSISLLLLSSIRSHFIKQMQLSSIGHMWTTTRLGYLWFGLSVAGA